DPGLTGPETARRLAEIESSSLRALFLREFWPLLNHSDQMPKTLNEHFRTMVGHREITLGVLERWMALPGRDFATQMYQDLFADHWLDPFEAIDLLPNIP